MKYKEITVMDSITHNIEEIDKNYNTKDKK